MKRRSWILTALMIVGTSGFLLSRTVWGPSSKAMAAETKPAPELTDNERRFIQNQPNHWRTMTQQKH